MTADEFQKLAQDSRITSLECDVAIAHNKVEAICYGMVEVLGDSYAGRTDEAIARLEWMLRGIIDVPDGLNLADHTRSVIDGIRNCIIEWVKVFPQFGRILEGLPTRKISDYATPIPLVEIQRQAELHLEKLRDDVSDTGT